MGNVLECTGGGVLLSSLDEVQMSTTRRWELYRWIRIPKDDWWRLVGGSGSPSSLEDCPDILVGAQNRYGVEGAGLHMAHPVAIESKNVLKHLTQIQNFECVRRFVNNWTGFLFTNSSTNNWKRTNKERSKWLSILCHNIWCWNSPNFTEQYLRLKLW